KSFCFHNYSLKLTLICLLLNCPVFGGAYRSIPEVEMTTQGALPPLDVTNVIDAERACTMKGNVRIEKENDKNEKLSQMENGDQATYKYLDFGEGISSVSIRYNTLNNCRLLIYASEGGQTDTIAEVALKPAHDSFWTEETYNVQMTKGIKALTFEAVGGEGHLCDIDWFKFSETVISGMK
ncbi:MAG: carbohydrate-binding protein, partial [Prolixibacteraceae bacterium]|nr:carbohydrate-binding protein [Prolixibacteraceae bacterium]